MARDERITEVRKLNLQRLVDSDRFGGKKTAFALAVERSASQIGHWLKGHRNPNGDTCRDVEDKLGIPRGSLDIDPADLPNDEDTGKPAGAHGVSLWPDQTPFLTREEIRVKEPKGKFLLELWDNALGMRLPAGTVVKFDADKRPNIGDGVLIVDAAGNFFVRQLHESLTHEWEAAPVSGNYARLDPTKNGARIIAVLCGVEAGLGQLLG